MAIDDYLAAIAERLTSIERAIDNYIQTVHEERDRQHERENIPTQIDGTFRLPEAVETQRTANQERQHTTQKVIAIAAWAAFIAALAYAVVAQLTLNQIRDQTAQIYHQSEIDNANASGQNAQLFRQLNIAQQQAIAAQHNADAITKQMREDERAWLAISIGNISWGDGKPISVPIAVTNIGKTAAKKFTIDVVVRQVENTPEGGKSITFKYNHVPHFIDFVGYILPNDPSTNFIVKSQELAPDKKTVQDAAMSHESAIRFMRGEEFVIVYTEAKYVDIFGRSHWTRFCKYTSLSDKSVYAAKCAIYDDVDAN